MFLAGRDVVEPHAAVVLPHAPRHALRIPQVTEDLASQQAVGRPEVPAAEVRVDHEKLAKVARPRHVVTGDPKLADDLTRHERPTGAVRPHTSPLVAIAPEQRAVRRERGIRLLRAVAEAIERAIEEAIDRVHASIDRQRILFLRILGRAIWQKPHHLEGGRAGVDVEPAVEVGEAADLERLEPAFIHLHDSIAARVGPNELKLSRHLAAKGPHEFRPRQRREGVAAADRRHRSQPVFLIEMDDRTRLPGERGPRHQICAAVDPDRHLARRNAAGGGEVLESRRGRLPVDLEFERPAEHPRLVARIEHSAAAILRRA